ncbi:Beta-mannosidase [Bacteroides ovatus]|nr:MULTISPECIES: discoidin domain-containing protein [Bacteroides]MCS3176706.1 discoidin domain-containing protein [Candidatus Bacteroides intestinigallinarum]RGN66381.1 beta-mannosidase [Bacteroides sp. OM05-10AA]RGQ68641.1 beta-mannosidase [Bacteroides sp. AF27-33]CAG9902151.1 Beta-mannosidase [Bacteroides ovatus]
MNRIIYYIVSVVLVLVQTACTEQVTKMSLNSSDPRIVWEVKPQADLENVTGEQISTPGFEIPEYVKGVVPGTVFTAYVEAGIVPDPNYADNIYKVDETFYNRPFWYRTEFELPDSYSEGKRVWLHFDNTNRFADFYFNGEKISGTKTSTKDVSGHMLRSKFDVTHLVKKSGKNAIAVLITDPDQKKTRKAKDPYGVACSPSYLAGAGWDWMPYVPGRLAGITGNTYLMVTGDVVMEDPWVRSELPTLQKAELSISTNVRNASSSPKKVVVSGVIQPGNISFSKEVQVEGGATAGLSISKEDIAQLVIDQPKLWWPNGYGDPNLYTCKLTCSVDGEVSDVKDLTFGIKKYEYKMVDNVVGYPVLTFFINGQKIYLKGGNWGMSEYLLRCQGKEYETKIRLHKEMNYNMIRLWTGCVTDDEFYDYCDKYGIMVWNDFWLYVAYNDVAQPEAFKANALDKVRRLRNHPSIAIWCGANETHPASDLDNYLREMIAKEDHNDRMYKSCSNQDGLSGSGWWGNQPPRHHFETSGSNLAFNTPAYPYGIDHGYGMRTEIGTATFPTFESVKEFIPEKDWWPLPTDEQLKNDDDNVWNKHFFGKEASNANPVNYKNSVNMQYGESSGLEEFCEKAQLLNIEVMKGMYEAWNDKMWNDAAGLLIWMSHPAYPSFVWQTYDYYYDPTGAYWGAKKACEPLHIQWNASNNSIKVINTTAKDLKGATVKATIYDLNGKEIATYGQTKRVDVTASNIAEAFTLNFNPFNLAFGKEVVASSSTGDSKKASLVTDGGAGSRWESEYNDPQWIYVDLGKEEKIENVILKWETACAKKYALQVSNDAKEWKTVYDNKDGKGGTEKIDLESITARYVKLEGISRATQFGYSLFEFEIYGEKPEGIEELTPLHFIKLELTDANGNLLSENFYWRNGVRDLDYTQLNTLPEADLSCRLVNKLTADGKMQVAVKNNSKSVAFANRIRLVNKVTQKRVLPVIMSDNYVTLMPDEEKVISIEAAPELLKGGVSVLVKQYGKAEKSKLDIMD